jgi:hypothetical protein
MTFMRQRRDISVLWRDASTLVLTTEVGIEGTIGRKEDFLGKLI